MPTDPLIARIRARTPLHTKVAVSKVFDLAEEVGTALARAGHTPEWLAGQVGISLEELGAWLSGMHPLLDDVARLEAALGADLLVAPGRPQGYFGVESPGARLYFGEQDVARSLAYTTEPKRVAQPNYLSVSVQTEGGEQRRRYAFENAA